jgi:wobble nucleotide-excising tRNase
MYFDEGMKIVQIARRTNISTNTIRKFVKLTDFNIVNKSKPNESKILAYEPYILELLKQERKLSEGERNFIAFLYFYYLVQGSWKREELIKGKIVVIDDPVSSMDSNVLSIVGSLVRELIDDCFCDGSRYNIKQIFILTHNPYFHNAVSQQMLRPEEAYFKKVSFFEVKKGDDNISTISAPCVLKVERRDPDITHENYTPVQNSYSALWQEYKDARLLLPYCIL